MKNHEDLVPIVVGLFGLICLAVVSGCTVAYDRFGNPIGAGVIIAASEEATDAQRIGGAIQDTAADVAPWLPAPYGELLTLGAGALGAGVLGARSRKRGDELFDEGVKRGANREVSA